MRNKYYLPEAPRSIEHFKSRAFAMYDVVELYLLYLSL